MTVPEFIQLLKGFIENSFTIGNLKRILALLILFSIFLTILSIKFTLFYEGKPKEKWMDPNVTETIEEGRFQISYNNAEGRCVDLTVFDVKRNFDYTLPICNDLKLPLEDWGFIQINEVYPKYGSVSFYTYKTYRINTLIPFSVFIILVFGLGMLIRRLTRN